MTDEIAFTILVLLYVAVIVSADRYTMWWLKQVWLVVTGWFQR